MKKIQSVKTSLWRKYLQSLGLRYDRTTGDHEIWKKADLARPIVFRSGKKEVEAFHIQTCLRTLGVDKEAFLNWLEQED